MPPPPKDEAQLSSFLGLVNYYARFLPNLSTVLAPLNRLKSKNVKFEWTPECDSAFEEVKQLVVSRQILTHYDPILPLKLDCDASCYGIGAVISHTFPDGSEKPVAFASRSLTSSERNYAQIEREALGIIFGVRRFHQYLYGRSFVLVTDHKPLTTILHPQSKLPSLAAARMQRWAFILSAYNYTIEYRSTLEHANADALSRLPSVINTSPCDPVENPIVKTFHMDQTNVLPVSLSQLQTETRRDPVLSRVYQAVTQGWIDSMEQDADLKPFFTHRHEIILEQQILVWGIRTIIPNKFQPSILQELHEGHIGITKMKALARSYIWWPGVDKDIEQLGHKCKGCQQTQNMPAKTQLHPWEYPAKPFQRVHIDFAGPFLNRMYLVLVDAHTKWPEVIITNTTTSEWTVSALRSIFARFGIPEHLVSDNGSQFSSDFFQEFCSRNGIKHTFSAPYHPSTNGLAERFMQSMKKALKAAKDEKSTIQCKLDKFLTKYRNVPHSTTGESPAFLMMGRSVRTRMDLFRPNLQKTVKDKQDAEVIRCGGDQHKFKVGQPVLVRDYRINNSNKWAAGVILKENGPVSFIVDVNGEHWRRHVDQIRSSVTMENESVINENVDIHVPNISDSVSQHVGSNSDIRQSQDILVDGTVPTVEVPRDPPRTNETVIETPSLRRSTRERRAPEKLNLYIDLK